jgi:hypothetical protein
MMRYRLATIVIVISFFVLTGCGGGTSQAQQTPHCLRGSGWPPWTNN